MCLGRAAYLDTGVNEHPAGKSVTMNRNKVSLLRVFQHRRAPEETTKMAFRNKLFRVPVSYARERSPLVSVT